MMQQEGGWGCYESVWGHLDVSGGRLEGVRAGGGRC